MIDYQELKRLAEAARYANASFVTLRDFSVATSPANVLALIAEVETLRESATFKAVQSLRADCEDLRKDAERFQHIENCCDTGMSRIYGDNWVQVIDDYISQGVK